MSIRFIGLLVMLSSCMEPAQELSVSIGGEVRSSTPVNTQYFVHNYPEEGLDVLYKASVDTGRFRFKTEHPLQLFLAIGTAQIPLYVQAGDSLHWTADYRAVEESLRFTGEGASINNYISKKNRLINSFEQANEAMGISADQFFEQEQQLLEDLQYLLTSMVNKSNAFFEIESAALLAEWANSRYYFLITSGDLVAKKDTSYWQKVPKNSGDFLINQSYRTALSNWQNQMVQLSNPTNFQSGYHTVFEEAFKISNDQIKDFLLATNLHTRIDYFGIDGLEKDYSVYKKAFRQSSFLEALSAKYVSRERLRPGNPAPDMAFQRPDGSTVRLSDFLGKPIYIDVWASWCKPCLKEIPFRKPLAEVVAGRAVLLNVSVDDQQAAWSGALKKFPDFDGVHVQAPRGWQSDFMNAFLIQEIPKYILIDAGGRIITLTGPPPSESARVLSELNLPFEVIIP